MSTVTQEDWDWLTGLHGAAKFRQGMKFFKMMGGDMAAGSEPPAAFTGGTTGV